MEFHDIVAKTMNILEHDYGCTDLESLGTPTVEEIANRLSADDKAPADSELVEVIESGELDLYVVTMADTNPGPLLSGSPEDWIYYHFFFQADDGKHAIEQAEDARESTDHRVVCCTHVPH